MNKNRIPLQAVACSQTDVCTMALCIVSRLEEVLKERASNLVDQSLGNDPDKLPNFCIVALDHLLSTDVKLQYNKDDFLNMDIERFMDFVVETAETNPKTFALLISKLFIFYGYEEEFMNEW